ncbi:MAG TPA: hypothetical protein VKE22_31050, partial [Haliangiales bacterium]|nr:hypothetical protein [Haliangiales bacterium]
MRRLAFAMMLAACGQVGEQSDAGTVTATFTSLYGDYFSHCSQCHAPGAPGRTSDIEQTLDFSTRTTAYTTIKTGMATGLMGNFSACNTVPFIDAQPGRSLILAVLDQPTRQLFDLPAHPNCDVNTISDETVKVGSAPSAAFIAALKGWLQAGA